MGMPEGGMVSEELSRKQPEVSLLTCSVIKHKRSRDFPSEKNPPKGDLTCYIKTNERKLLQNTKPKAVTQPEAFG